MLPGSSHRRKVRQPENSPEAPRRSGGQPQHWFGSQPVDGAEKRRRVHGLFTDVAARYDLMNDLMSLGMHRLWKSCFLTLARLRPEHRILEIACGSADLAKSVLDSMSEAPVYLLTDINHAMLSQGRAKLLDAGHCPPMSLMDAERLALADASFDRVFLSFGLRNITDQPQCLREMRRVLKPEGMALIMEFSLDLPPSLMPLYKAYTLHWLPKLGQWVAGNEEGYRYLAESIRKQPRCEQMCKLLSDSGYSRVRANKLAFGAVSIYRAWR